MPGRRLNLSLLTLLAVASACKKSTPIAEVKDDTPAPAAAAATPAAAGESAAHASAYILDSSREVRNLLAQIGPDRLTPAKTAEFINKVQDAFARELAGGKPKSPTRLAETIDAVSNEVFGEPLCRRSKTGKAMLSPLNDRFADGRVSSWSLDLKPLSPEAAAMDNRQRDFDDLFSKTLNDNVDRQGERGWQVVEIQRIQGLAVDLGLPAADVTGREQDIQDRFRIREALKIRIRVEAEAAGIESFADEIFDRQDKMSERIKTLTEAEVKSLATTLDTANTEIKAKLQALRQSGGTPGTGGSAQTRDQRDQVKSKAYERLFTSFNQTAQTGGGGTSVEDSLEATGNRAIEATLVSEVAEARVQLEEVRRGLTASSPEGRLSEAKERELRTLADELKAQEDRVRTVEAAGEAEARRGLEALRGRIRTAGRR